jgi:3-hydroxyisobutyrate dehydrogenase-like beta-hydroxyacid dehydrogenase
MVVGVVGVGRMGLAVCARLADRSFDVVATDRRSEVRASVADAGARWVNSAWEVASCCGVVLTLLPGAVELTAIGEQLVSAMAPGSTWIDLTTSTPAAARRSAELASCHGVRVLDAPMGGGPVQAREGNLVLFVGGSVVDLEAQRVVTDAIADRVLHVGGAGSGCLVKLLVNLLWFGHAIAGAEVLSLAARAGLDPELVRSVVSESAGASRFMDRDAGALLAGDDLASFSLAGCVEELNAITTLAGELKVPLALGSRIADLYAQALEHYGDVDGELLAARLVSERAGVDFKRSIP